METKILLNALNDILSIGISDRFINVDKDDEFFVDACNVAEMRYQLGRLLEFVKFVNEHEK